ncbi:TIGR01777 family protein [Mucilaginibacter sp. ZT4R22]|uniref:TIGR01777 family protein n=1 Tax=Mucilaginibacter pankratovii TaxID=2772110 RepID=A0ABR7WIN5_9SPHI|nr:TIGR01777 family oxidoreductase [Mucilaginibacter pankratovii]MBD1362176.1 TIGR01777 family protein [Mucilaginibacter pankratovii]
MKYHKIVLAGGNGYLGTVLAAYYKNLAEEIILLSRRPAVADGNIKTLIWDGKTEGDWVAALNGADMLVNLCGKNVNCRYTEENKREIINSRVIPTTLLGKVINKLANPPKLWINLASATIYRHAEDHAQDEATGEIGYGFSIDVCTQWEQSFFDADTPNTRKIALRHGIALGRSDSVFPRLLNLVKLGMGGKQGDGEQYIAWIHEHDTARITEFLMEHTELDGVINAAAPEAAKNKDLMHIIRKAYGIPFGLPAPQWLLEIGAKVIGTETELILKSRWVTPKRLLDAGFVFQFPKAEHAIHDILSLRV